MKNILKTIRSLLEGFDKARAATVLSRAGRHEEAKKLMISD